MPSSEYSDLEKKRSAFTLDLITKVVERVTNLAALKRSGMKNHRLANGEGRSATLGNVLFEASTTICFSWLIYPLKKFRYIWFATRHSTSSSGTSWPDIRSATWKRLMGIRVALPVATHLFQDQCQKDGRIKKHGAQTFS